jgi:hypothetical protein
MKMKIRLQRLFLIAVMLSIGLSRAHAQGTAFTYQGQLNSGGNPANGSYDFTFSLFNTNNAGSSSAGPITNTIVPVINGLFTTILDFHSSPGGSPIWLEIAVRTNGGGSFTTLSPRQPLLPAPYAMFANTASNLLGSVTATQLNGALSSYSGAVAFTSGGNSFNGNGNGLVNVNAATLDGLAATNFWNTTGNSGTSPANGNFLGTTDNQPLEIKVNGVRALRLEPTTNSPNLIGGYSGNVIGPGIYGATIGGGGTTNQPNSILAGAPFATIAGGVGNTVTNYGGSVMGGVGNLVGDSYGTVGGGQFNKVFANSSVIGGGFLNTIQNGALDSAIFGGINNTIQSGAYYSTIGNGSGNTIQSGAYESTIIGGVNNLIQPNTFGATIGSGVNNTIQSNAYFATIIGGNLNTIQSNAFNSVIGGGNGNIDTGPFAMIPGGTNNTAAAYAFAAGSGALATNQGAFVWADSSSPDNFNSTANNQFLVRAAGGVGINTNNPGSAALKVNGTVVATSFFGDGGGLTGITASFPAGNVSAALNFTNTANSYTGNGAGLTGVTASFPAGNVSAALNFTNTANSYTGNGAGLTGINVNITNVSGGNAGSAFNFTNPANTFSGTFSGNGAGLTGVTASFPAGNVSAALNFTNAANAFNGTFNGNGAGLTNLTTAANYIYTFDTTTQTVTTANTFKDVTFNTGAQINKWTHGIGTPSFTNNQSGLYLIQYGAEVDATSGTASSVSVRAVLNGTEIAGSQSSSIALTPPNKLMLSRSFIASFTAGDILKLQFTGSSTSDRLVNNGSGTTLPSISMTVIRIQ